MLQLRLLTVQYEIYTKSELFYFLSESFYLIASERQRTEDNKSLEMSALAAVCGLVFLVLEFMTFGKLRNIKSLFLSLFQHLYYYTAMKSITFLPLLVDWALGVLDNPALGRLKTYDHQLFHRVRLDSS